MILSLAEASSDETSVLQKNRATTKTITSVVNHAFCESSLSEEVKVRGKKTLEEVHTYAELKHDPRASLPHSFSICSSIMRTTCCPTCPWPSFFAILDLSQFLAACRNQGSLGNSKFQMIYPGGSTETVIGKVPPFFPNQWTKSCIAINTMSGLVHWVVEGNLVMNTTSEQVKKSKSQPKDLSGKLILGATLYGGRWFSPSHKVTNLNIFSSVLSIEKMKSITGEEEGCIEEGDYLAWGDMEWILHGHAKIETLDKEEACKGEPNVNLYYTTFQTMDLCMRHCEKLGTKVPSITNSQDWAALQNSLKRILYDKGLNTIELWLPIEDRKTEGEWKDFYTRQPIQNFTQPWAGSGPDGGLEQNCAVLLDGDTWGDATCSSSHRACMCKNKPRSYLELKGRCPGSSIDDFYKPMNNLTDSRELIFQGLDDTLIRYNKEENMWKLKVGDSNVTGFSKATYASEHTSIHATFALGKHNWTIQGDKGCSSGESYVREMKLSGCEYGNFTCSDGECVSMDERCNQLPDCKDKSDESNCKILVLEDSYNKNVPPIYSNHSVNVSISIDLLRLVDIDEEDYSIEIQFEIMLKWKENRAMYNNLKRIDALNALTQEDIQKLWLPEVIYENTDQKESTRLGEFGAGEWKTSLVVKREEEKGMMSGLESVDETEIFDGSQNSLIMNQSYTHTFQCNYELSHYPFDTQVNHRFLLFA